MFVYNENCVMAGRAVPIREIEASDDPENACDWHDEEVTEENAAYHENFAGGRPNSYHLRIAQTIREAM
jgi:hypothetical protein